MKITTFDALREKLLVSVAQYPHEWDYVGTLASADPRLNYIYSIWHKFRDALPAHKRKQFDACALQVPTKPRAVLLAYLHNPEAVEMFLDPYFSVDALNLLVDVANPYAILLYPAKVALDKIEKGASHANN